MRRHHFRGAIALGAVIALTACDSQSPVHPTSAAPRPIPGFFLTGRVVDTAYRPLAGARVEAVTGPRRGTFEITDEAGRFAIDGLFTDVVTISVSKDGYLSETRIFPPERVPVNQLVEGGSWDAQFYLAPLGPSTDIAGEYTLTLTADRACTTLPAETRTRTYTARIAAGDRAGFFSATLSDAAFFSESCPVGRLPESCTYNRFGIGLAGDYVSLFVGIVERMNGTTYLAFEAGTEGTFGPTGISAPLDGYLLYCPVEPTWNEGWVCQSDRALQCDSHAHHLTLIRR